MAFEKNDPVRIIDGPFAHFPAKVEEVRNEQGTLKVLVKIFDRMTPMELKFSQVEKS